MCSVYVHTVNVNVLRHCRRLPVSSCNQNKPTWVPIRRKALGYPEINGHCHGISIALVATHCFAKLRDLRTTQGGFRLRNTNVELCLGDYASPPWSISIGCRVSRSLSSCRRHRFDSASDSHRRLLILLMTVTLPWFFAAVGALHSRIAVWQDVLMMVCWDAKDAASVAWAVG